jgi:hypothetical protein
MQVNALTQSLAMTSTHPLIALPEAAELLATALEADVVGCAFFVCMHIIAHGACACAWCMRVPQKQLIDEEHQTCLPTTCALSIAYANP